MKIILHFIVTINGNLQFFCFLLNFLSFFYFHSQMNKKYNVDNISRWNSIKTFFYTEDKNFVLFYLFRYSISSRLHCSDINFISIDIVEGSGSISWHLGYLAREQQLINSHFLSIFRSHLHKLTIYQYFCHSKKNLWYKKNTDTIFIKKIANDSWLKRKKKKTNKEIPFLFWFLFNKQKDKTQKL